MSWNIWTADDPYVGHSLHSVYFSFLPYLSSVACTPRQLSQLGALISGEVGKGGESENAAVTCFLEHLGQVGLARKLKPWLSVEAKLGLRP